MKLSLSQKILIGFVACTFILIGVSIFSYKNNEQFIESNAWVEHTHLVINELTDILNNSIDAESGSRGYIITGDESHLTGFNENKVQAYQHLQKLKTLTSDNPVQQQNLAEVEQKLNERVKHLDEVVALRRENVADARTAVLSGKGKRLQDELKQLINHSRDIEYKLLAERKLASENDARNFNLVFAALLVIILIVLIAVYAIIITNLRALKRAEEETENKNWLLTGSSGLNDEIQGEKQIQNLAQDVINQICNYTGARIGAIYLLNEDVLEFTAGYAFDLNSTYATQPIKPGQGLTGQALLENKLLTYKQIPADYAKINSATGSTAVKAVIAAPFTYNGKVKGIIELGTDTDFTTRHTELLKLITENIGIAVNSAQSRTRLKELLEETQAQSEELQSQQEELRQVNEELEEQAQNLKQQQEELQITNEELEEQTQALEAKNQEVEAARRDIEAKTKQLEISSRYKSEFLANMSHELRTPLNSLLILSRDLAENKNHNLTNEQVESAEIINKSGQDLLQLINEVLDLSKIEAGKMNVHAETIALQTIADDLYRNFKHQAENKGLLLSINQDKDIPERITTDVQRLNQILKNLLSNALKFTHSGSIQVKFSRYGTDRIAISVTDTGIGIPEDKQMAVFEAFQQADGGTSRKYGGTGLGLSISRELAKLLQAEIRLDSKVNTGSTFTVILPVSIADNDDYKQPAANNVVPTGKQPAITNSSYINYPTVDDDRNTIESNDKVLLIIEDDLKFATVLVAQAHQKGFKCLTAATGEDGLMLAKKYSPQAIILDLELPGIDGHTVLTELKAQASTRHIPVHIMSAEERSLKHIKEGAVAYLNKPINKSQLDSAFNRIENFISRKMKNLLIVEDDANSRKAMKTLIGNGDVKCYEAATGAEALKFFAENHVDCMVLDLGLPDMSGFELIRQLNSIKSELPPIIIYTGKELTREENDELQKYAESIIIKGVKSEERLLDETALFLHRTISKLPETKQHMIASLYDRESIFQGKKVLVVDDDMRNVFALSKILRDRGMEVIKAENGAVALKVLDNNHDVQIVLMDIMMPEMDGYEAMQRIRAQSKYAKLPIVALTAKAMKDDKQKCLDAGATDYIAKPVDVERLLTLMRVWLSK